ncbi:MAG: thiamine pyrophosphate-binding protein [Chloroflexi bacterium]|nr:thiamine pyrophosphate-binding protein [Chloroflexota bacterium]
MTSVAEFFVETLVREGVERIYGLPGGENVEILDAIRRGGIDFILARNESSACFMAATEARLKGTIGVALTTLGPGAAKAYAGLAHAYLDRAPVLLISAANDPEVVGLHTHQVIDLKSGFAPICKLSAELTAATAASIISRALTLARQNRPGPVHIALHNRIATQAIQGDASARSPVTASSHGATDAGGAQDLLRDKRRLVMIVGLGLEPDRPYPQIRALAESLNAPVIDTPKSKGALSAEHPLFAGTIGLTRDDPVYELLDEADCILAVGFDVVELVKPWDYKQPLIWIANWSNQDPAIACDLELIGNIAERLTTLGEVKAQAEPGWGTERVRRFRAALARRQLPKPASGRILPQTFLASLRASTHDDVIVTTDVGSHKIFAALEWPARRPNRYFVSNGLSAMGFGLSSAIAAAAVSRQAVVCITGDAGLAMVMGELGLLVERRLPVLIAVMNDSALDLIRAAQLRRGRPVFGTEFRNPDYAYIAKAHGMVYRRVASRAGCDAAIRAFHASKTPMLLDVMIDPVGYPTSV